MAERMNDFALTAAADLAEKRLIKLDSNGDAVLNTATATDNPIGATNRSANTGEVAGGFFLNKSGTMEMVAAGAITVGAEVYAAADGKVQALPAAAATYRKVGIAMDAASGDGSIIEVMPYDFGATTTVT